MVYSLVVEFNIQLKEMLSVLDGVPMVVLSSVTTQHVTVCRDDCEQLSATHRDNMDTLLAEQVSLQSDLSLEPRKFVLIIHVSLNQSVNSTYGIILVPIILSLL